MLPFIELPVDILYLILYELDVEGLIQISTTCRFLHEITDDRTVWFKQMNDIQYRLPFLVRDRPNLWQSTTDRLKQEGIRQSRLDDRWSKPNSEPGNIRSLDCGQNINFFTIFPGGEWLLIIYLSGRFCLKELKNSVGGAGSESVSVYLDERNMRNVMHNFWALRSTDGSAVLSMSQYYGTHSYMHFYRVCPSTLSIRYLGKKQLPRCRWASPIRSYPEKENMLACLHLCRDPKAMQLTLLLLSDSSPSSAGPFTCNSKATFDLGHFEPYTDSGLELDLFSLCIPYTHLLIVTHGSCRIRVYELPSLETLDNERSSRPIRVPIIWEWTTDYKPHTHFESTLLIPHTPCQRSHLKPTSRSLVHIVAEDTLNLHRLFLSVSKQSDPLHPYCTKFEHQTYIRGRTEVVGNSYLALRSYRGAWLAEGDRLGDGITFQTVSFRGDTLSKEVKSDEQEDYPLPIGSFKVAMGFSDPYLIDWDFDEVSGRFCLLISNGDHTHSVFLVDRAYVS